MSRAATLLSLRTWRGPIITLSRAVRCGNRLKLWNTIPTASRSLALTASGSRKRRPLAAVS